jgi:hypothetical protein
MLDELIFLLIPTTKRGWALLGFILAFPAAALLLVWAIVLK